MGNDPRVPRLLLYDVEFIIPPDGPMFAGFKAGMWVSEALRRWVRERMEGEVEALLQAVAACN